MLRKLGLIMAITLFVMPLNALALGLGKIKTHSALHEPFEAEIELRSLAAGELDSVKVELASKDAFSKAGVERLYLLSRLKFQTLQKDNGQAVIRVFSHDAISEPFLNFLVEVNWSEGQVVREFSVLLDIR